MYLAEPKVGFSFLFLIFSLKFHQQAAFWLFIFLFILLFSEMYTGNKKKVYQLSALLILVNRVFFFFPITNIKVL